MKNLHISLTDITFCCLIYIQSQILDDNAPYYVWHLLLWFVFSGLFRNV